MRFVMVYRGDEGTFGRAAEDAEVVEALMGEMARAGVLVSRGGRSPERLATRVRLCGEEYEVTEDPLTAEQAVGGYAVVEVGTRERAIELAKRFLAVAGHLVGEIRLIPEPAGF